MVKYEIWMDFIMKTSSFAKTLLTSATIGLVLFVGASAHASSLTVPDSMIIETINGNGVSFGSTIGLGHGQQLVEINYRDLFQDNADDSGHWVRSESLYLTLKVAQNQRYELATPVIYSAEDARDFLDNPQVTLSINGQHHKNVALVTQAQLLTQLVLK
jgi:uncharacterized protein YccT (UPF0319 family)